MVKFLYQDLNKLFKRTDTGSLWCYGYFNGACYYDLSLREVLRAQKLQARVLFQLILSLCFIRTTSL